MGKIATRRTILGAALALFTTRGLHETSTASIAREAGVATGTLFHHFASKAELIDALQKLIAGHRRRLLSDAVDPAAATSEQIGALIRADLRWAAEHPDQERFLRLHALMPRGTDDADAAVPALLEVLERGRAAGELRELPPACLARCVLGVSAALAGYLADAPAARDDDAFLDGAAAMAWQAVARPTGAAPAARAAEA